MRARVCLCVCVCEPYASTSGFGGFALLAAAAAAMAAMAARSTSGHRELCCCAEWHGAHITVWKFVLVGFSSVATRACSVDLRASLLFQLATYTQSYTLTHTPHIQTHIHKSVPYRAMRASFRTNSHSPSAFRVVSVRTLCMQRRCVSLWCFVSEDFIVMCLCAHNQHVIPDGAGLFLVGHTHHSFFSFGFRTCWIGLRAADVWHVVWICGGSLRCAEEIVYSAKKYEHKQKREKQPVTSTISCALPFNMRANACSTHFLTRNASMKIFVFTLNVFAWACHISHNHPKSSKDKKYLIRTALSIFLVQVLSTLPYKKKIKYQISGKLDDCKCSDLLSQVFGSHTWTSTKLHTQKNASPL